jgi:hypothetical protein
MKSQRYDIREYFAQDAGFPDLSMNTVLVLRVRDNHTGKFFTLRTEFFRAEDELRPAEVAGVK